ncbi:hypothetical protein [Streptomyces sp. NPDC091278]|uniref:hypothetical protein n=1 Tax=Streptomyces sp. NPDC091278 TaxID=3155301 RepID=UPI00344D84D3
MFVVLVIRFSFGGRVAMGSGPPMWPGAAARVVRPGLAREGQGEDGLAGEPAVGHGGDGVGRGGPVAAPGDVRAQPVRCRLGGEPGEVLVDAATVHQE